MKFRLALLLLLMAHISYAQEYNSYLVTKGKSGSGPALKTNEKILGYISSKNKIESWWLPSCPPSGRYNAERVVGYPGLIDPVQAKIDPAGLKDVVLLTLGGKKIGYGMINCDGNLIIPPYYTLRHMSLSYKAGETERYNFFGQKMSNGNWRAVSFDEYDPTGEVRVYSFPEKKDYNLLNPSLVLFRDLNGKYGLMDFHGNELLPAQYDTCYLDYGYIAYPLSSKTETLIKTSYKTMPYSFERDYRDNLVEISESHAAYSRGESSDGHSVYLLKSGDTTLLASSEYITQPVVKGVVSAHSFGLTQFFLLKGTGNDMEIINFSGTAPDRAHKYAYYESIRRDTTAGTDRNWMFDKSADYSRPFKAMTADSVKMAEAEKLAAKKREEAALKELEYAAIRKIALADQEMLRNDPENYSNIVAGTYDITELSEHSVAFRKTGSFDGSDHNISIVTGRKNRVFVTMKYKGMRNQWDAQYFTYELNAGLNVVKTGEGYSLSDSSDGVNDRQNAGNAKSLRSIAGYYDPSKMEIELSFTSRQGEQFTVLGAKRMK